MLVARDYLLLGDETYQGAGVKVAILDTGIDDAHPDLADRSDIVSQSFTTKADLIDRNGHGSHIAGIIGGTGKASNGVFRGVAPECTMMIYKISESQSAFEDNAAAAIEAAINDGADIINYSHGKVPTVGGPAPWIWSSRCSALEEMFKIAASRGILCVAAAGNAGPNEGTITSPGGLAEVLTVGAIDSAGKLLSDSSRGPYRTSSEIRPGGARRFDAACDLIARAAKKPDLVLPGKITAPRAKHSPLSVDEDLDTADPLYICFSGTSQATALCSGLSALALGLLRERAADLGDNAGHVLRRLLIKSASSLQGYSPNEVGAGVLLWQKLASVVEDYAESKVFRDLIMNPDQNLRLI